MAGIGIRIPRRPASQSTPASPEAPTSFPARQNRCQAVGRRPGAPAASWCAQQPCRPSSAAPPRAYATGARPRDRPLLRGVLRSSPRCPQLHSDPPFESRAPGCDALPHGLTSAEIRMQPCGPTDGGSRSVSGERIRFGRPIRVTRDPRDLHGPCSARLHGRRRYRTSNRSPRPRSEPTSPGLGAGSMRAARTACTSAAGTAICSISPCPR